VSERATPRLLEHRRAERVAGLDVALLEAATEPADALLRRTVGEALRSDVAACAALQAVVADRARRRQRFFHVARFEDLTRAVGVIRPDAGEAVRLELELDGECVPFRL